MYSPRKRTKIPATMVSQHPDHASAPYWQKDPFITTAQETKELYLSFSELGATEYKWDWEGKLVDESVMERLLSQYYDYFKQNPLGVEKYITFRLPNPRVETEFRVGRSFMNLISSSAMARAFGLPDTPLFEVILPMTVNSQEMMEIHEAFFELASLKHKLYRMDENPLKNLKVIPLFEEINTIADSDQILIKYLSLYKKRFKRAPQYLRPYVARSDPALNSGIVPTVLSIKIALSKYAQLQKSTGIPMYPIIGAASLPFRGGLTPIDFEDFIKEYRGVRTTLLQSAFRYDYPLKDVIKAVSKIEELLPKQKPQNVPAEEEKELRKIMNIFESDYKSSIESIAGLVNQVASHLPKRRERVQHTGLFGYSRGIGKVKLPRAIGFTAALYSIGVPPELIGTGRGLKQLNESQLKLLQKYYLNIRKDLSRSGRYLNKKNLEKLAQKEKVWKQIQEDVTGVEEFLKQPLEPQTNEEKAHFNLTTKIYSKLEKDQSLTALITSAAILRKSLG